MSRKRASSPVQPSSLPGHVWRWQFMAEKPDNGQPLRVRSYSRGWWLVDGQGEPKAYVYPPSLHTSRYLPRFRSWQAHPGYPIVDYVHKGAPWLFPPTKREAFRVCETAVRKGRAP